MPIADYRLIRKLAQGGFGTVHLAVQGDGAKVALKRLRLPNDDNLRRFYREAKLLHQQLRNPHVVDLLDYGFEDDVPFIVMEYCAGGSLRAWVGESKDWRLVCLAMFHAAAGLKGIHEAGGFHRDIKPDNLLVAHRSDGPLVVKVGDFGLARAPDVQSSGPMTRNAWGTHGYMAPELCLGSPFDRRCDVFSLGTTFIELLTGSRALSSLQARSDLPAELHHLLRGMIHPDPNQRPSTDEFQRVLVRVTQVEVASPSPKQDGVAGVTGLVLGLGLGLGALALATMNTQDANGRFRGRDGRFRSGRWG